jgi:hypothetical protein
LNGDVKDLTLPPYFNDSTQLLLHFVGGALVGDGGRFRNDGGEGDEEVIFLSGFGLLRDFCDPTSLARFPS